MSIAKILIWTIALIAIGAIVYWFVAAVALPAPWNIVLYAVFAIVAILVILKLVSSSGQEIP